MCVPKAAQVLTNVTRTCDGQVGGEGRYKGGRGRFERIEEKV